AELFYEGLRYLQGRAPSPETGDLAADDGFAIWNTRDDPVTESCQRSVAAMIGHSSFVSDWYVPGNSKPVQGDKARAADGFHGSFDVEQAMRSMGALEDSLSNAKAYDSYYFAGAAYWAHTNPIRADASTPLDTLALELDAPAGKGSSALALAAKYGAFVDRNGDKNPLVTVAGESPGIEWSLDGSTPAGLFAGADPHAVVAAVRELFAAARHRRGEVSSHAASGPGFLVRASYDRQQSSGTLRRYAVVRDTAGQLQIADVPAWDAAQVLPLAANRKIYTLAVDGEGQGETVEFKWAGLPDSLMSEAQVNFLRGERSLELGNAGGVFRRRATALGDIVHSKPVIVGAPSPSVQGIGYASFHATHKGRRSVVYVGANDGMLHAFDAITGVELFAYVPAALHPSLAELSTPGYVHRSYVDGSPGVGEALVRGKWRTVLASGMGMGARGVFALDVTVPSNFGGALWEFTERDDASIGHVTHAPSIAKIKIGVEDETPQFRHFVVVASGINNYVPDGDDAAARGALFLLSLDKAPSEKWKRGVNYYKLVTPLPEAGTPNALAPPGFALAPDGSVRFAYAGDLQGNMWRFDLSGKPPWTKAVGPGVDGQPLFVARDPDGNRQPVTHAPRVAFAPGGGYLVLFGTGKFIENADLDSSTFSVQSLYAVRDSVAKPAVLVGGRGELARRIVSGTGPYTIAGETLRFEGSSARKGWYIDLPNWLGDGERAAATPLLVSGALILESIAPGSAPCATRVGRTYVIDAVSGLAYTSDGTPANAQVTGHAVDQAAALSPPLLFDLGMVAGQRDPTGAVAAMHSVAIVRARSDGKPPLALPVTVKALAGRLSWREVANWQEMHDAAKKEKK
ncbi:MAG TPA: PilC/PilY family type IV pilus protein, partial [Telluria sp.]